MFPVGVPSGTTRLAVNVTVCPGNDGEVLLVRLIPVLIFGSEIVLTAEVLLRKAELDGLNCAVNVC